MANLVRFPLHVADTPTNMHLQHIFTYTSIGHATLGKRSSGPSGQIPSPCGRNTYTHASTGIGHIVWKKVFWAIWSDSLSMWQNIHASTTHLYIHKHWTCNSGIKILWAIWSDSLSMWQTNPLTHTQICMQAFSMQVWDLNLSSGQSGQIPSPCGKQIKHMLTHLHIRMKHAPLGNLSSGATW